VPRVVEVRVEEQNRVVTQPLTMSSKNSTNDDNNDSNTKTIVVEDFSVPTNTWTTMNDPVMGGQSYSELEIDAVHGIAKFTGKCAIVPSLQAPGFITMETGGQFGEKPARFPDISTCTAFRFEMKTNTDYGGYRFSFGKAHAKGGRFAYGYKAPLLLPVGEFGSVVVPFTSFSDKWNDATGDIEIECADDPTYCPSQQWLQTMETMSFWGEGVEGMIDLEVKSISAIGCGDNASDNFVTPSMITSTIHTIGSNPFYLAAVVTMAVLVCIFGTFCYYCCCRGRCNRSKAMQEPIRPTITSTYQDSEPIDQFNDELDGKDIESS